jgi:excisionase family DNA binding protein
VGAGIAFLLMRELIEEMENESQPAPATATNGTGPRQSSTGAKRVQIPIEEDAAPNTEETAITKQPPVKPMEPDRGRALSTREAGEMLGLNPAEIRTLIDEGELPAHKEGRYWRIYEADVRDYQQRQS